MTAIATAPRGLNEVLAGKVGKRLAGVSLRVRRTANTSAITSKQEGTQTQDVTKSSQQRGLNIRAGMAKTTLGKRERWEMVS